MAVKPDIIPLEGTEGLGYAASWKIAVNELIMHATTHLK